MRHGASDRDAFGEPLADALAVGVPFVRHGRRAFVIVDGLARSVPETGKFLRQNDLAQCTAGRLEALRRLLDRRDGFRLRLIPQWRAADADARRAVEFAASIFAACSAG